METRAVIVTVQIGDLKRQVCEGVGAVHDRFYARLRAIWQIFLTGKSALYSMSCGREESPACAGDGLLESFIQVIQVAEELGTRKS